MSRVENARWEWVVYTLLGSMVRADAIRAKHWHQNAKINNILKFEYLFYTKCMIMMMFTTYGTDASCQLP